jgi:hypothetical protein
MNSTITALYYGNPPPYEKAPAEPSISEKLYGKVKARREALAADLPPEQKAFLDAYDNALDALSAERERERFTEGFRMGVRLGAECFSEG